MNDGRHFLTSIPWILSGLVTFLVFIAWSQGFNWQWKNITAYQLFPFFGVWAFSLMWVHYAIDFLENIFSFKAPRMHWRVTRAIVLFAILAHPGILIWKRWHDGFGLTPLSVIDYAGVPLRFLIIFGMIAWLCFIAYELDRWYKKRPWFKWINYASDVAMLAILFHGLLLHGAILSGWFRFVWYFYGLSLLIFLARIYYANYQLGLALLPRTKNTSD